MKGDPKVIEHLNRALYNELTAINQYFLHAKMLKNWGLKELAEHEYKESIDEMKHADRWPSASCSSKACRTSRRSASCASARTRCEVLKADLALELEALPVLRDAISYCESIRDSVSRRLFTDILDSEEEHIDWIETQLALIDRVGEANYLITKIEE